MTLHFSFCKDLDCKNLMSVLVMIIIKVLESNPKFAFIRDIPTIVYNLNVLA